MLYSNLYRILFLIILFISSLYAIFRDQQGEYDWHIESIGYIDQSLKINDNYYIASQDNTILSNVRSIDGSIKWRNILPVHTVIKKYIVDSSSIYSINQLLVNSRNIFTINRYSIITGLLHWEIVINLSNDESKNQIIDLQLFNNKLFVLLHSKVIIISLLQSDQPTYLELIIDNNIALIKLTYPLYDSNNNNDINNDKLKFAMGYTLTNNLVILLINLSTNEIIYNKHENSIFSSINLLESYPIVSISYNNNKYYSNDNIISYTITNNSNKILLKYYSYNLLSDRVITSTTSLDIASVTNYKYTVISTDKADVIPVISICGKSDNDNYIKCYIISARINNFQLTNQIDQVVIGDVVNVNFEYIPFINSIASDITATSYNYSNTDTHIKSFSMQLTTTSIKATSNELTIPGSYISIHHSTVHNNHLLIQFSNGFTGYINLLSNHIVWYKEESLSTVIDFVLLNDVDKIVNNVKINDINDELPSFDDRLSLQKIEFLEMIAAIGSISPDTIYNYLYKSINIVNNALPIGLRIPINSFESISEQVVPRVGSSAARAKLGNKKLGVFLCKNKLGRYVIIGLDVISGKVIWSTEISTNYLINELRLLVTKKVVGIQPNEITLLGYIADLATLYSWTLETSKGTLITSTYPVDCSLGSPIHKVMKLEDAVKIASGQIVSIVNNPIIEIANSSHCADILSYHILIKDPSSKDISVIELSKLPDSCVVSSNKLFYHTIDKSTGIINIYNHADMNLKLLSTLHFPVESETIVHVYYPSADDIINSRTITLGDDSILLKYVNPNIAIVAALVENSIELQSDIKTENKLSIIYLTIIDLISGKTIHRITHENAYLPVQLSIIENNIIFIYWNRNYQRTELSSISLFDNLIDRYSLHPFATPMTSKTMEQLSRASNFSSFSSINPLILQKSYIIPKFIIGMEPLFSINGIRNKNLLLATTSGQLLQLDLRQISTRRPLTEPTNGEKEQGLIQYHPIVTFNTLAYLTLDKSIGRSKKLSNKSVIIHSTSTRLESTGIVVTSWGLDLFMNIVSPSQSFDSLASDFNYILLVMILTTLAFLVLLLHRQVKSKALKSAWL